MQHGRDRVADAYDEAKKYAKEDQNMASTNSGDAKDSISEAMWYGHGGDLQKFKHSLREG